MLPLLFLIYLSAELTLNPGVQRHAHGEQREREGGVRDTASVVGGREREWVWPRERKKEPERGLK